MKQLLHFDFKLQWRQGFWLVYSIITFIYLVILLSIPSDNRFLIAIILIFSDTSVLGITFVGALVLLEKQQKILHSLFVTPLSLHTYLLSKTITLSLIALTLSSTLYAVSIGITPHFLLFSSSS